MKIVIYHSKECDPKRCTSIKLANQNKATITHQMNRIPYNAIVLDAEAKKAVSCEDREKITKYGLSALDCSWKKLKKSSFNNSTSAKGRQFVIRNSILVIQNCHKMFVRYQNNAYLCQYI